jgi:hypothetical protein
VPLALFLLFFEGRVEMAEVSVVNARYIPQDSYIKEIANGIFGNMFDVIRIIGVHGMRIKPESDIRDDCLNIALWGYFDEKQKTYNLFSLNEAYAIAWGRPIESATKCDPFKPSKRGVVITTPEGFEIAEVILPNIIVINYDITRYSTDNVLFIFEKILKESIHYFEHPEKYNDLRSAQKEAEIIDILSSTFKKEEDKLRKEFKNTSDEIDRIYKNLIELHANLEKLRSKIFGMKEFDKDRVEELKKEIS